MFCVYVYVLRAYKVVLLKTDFLYGLYTEIGFFAMHVFVFFA
jgi:hypothetical protein